MSDLVSALAIVAALSGVVTWAVVRVVGSVIRPAWAWRNTALRTLALMVGAACGGALRLEPASPAANVLTGAAAGALCSFVVWAVRAWVRRQVQP